MKGERNAHIVCAVADTLRVVPRRLSPSVSTPPSPPQHPPSPFSCRFWHGRKSEGKILPPCPSTPIRFQIGAGYPCPIIASVHPGRRSPLDLTWTNEAHLLMPSSQLYGFRLGLPLPPSQPTSTSRPPTPLAPSSPLPPIPSRSVSQTNKFTAPESRPRRHVLPSHVDRRRPAGAHGPDVLDAPP